ncbi:hypothetical protein RCO48_15290 [Peribacillus frigoritolerans]|nr:hypothetical protein [Peribacillus frigoritolerans]
MKKAESGLKRPSGWLSSKRDFQEWQEIFAEFEACAEPVLTFTEAAEHPPIEGEGNDRRGT